MKLKIGVIPYANLFPIFYTLRREADCADYEFVDGVPSDLNSRIRSGEIDISPSSSIEYLRHGDRYSLIDGHSVSSAGPIRSILLFSKKPIEALDAAAILTSSQSETSVALLKIILTKFYRIEARLEPSAVPVAKAMISNEAYLLIGDEALKEAHRWPNLRVYDLGDIWYKMTGLPSVFALWIARKELGELHPEMLLRFTSDLDRSRVSALTQLERIAAASDLLGLLSEESLISYWQSISYDFNDNHKKGLALFRTYAEELGIIDKKPLSSRNKD
ncbi:MAG: menaquinone biosynthesis protein [Nitrospirae bacterium]|nr:menaquinone biosynthesis protein [Nitrospirota bacterium]